MDDTEGVDLELDEGVFVSKFLVTRLTASMHSASSSSMEVFDALEVERWVGICREKPST